MQYECSVIEYSRWSRGNALALVPTTALAVWAETPALIGAVGGGSLVYFAYRTRSAWTPHGGFGLANTVSSLRLLLTALLLFAGLALPAWSITGIALVVVTLDGIDGWVARRFGEQSEFGGRYDTAIDSLYTLALSVLLSVRGVLGPWVLIAGLWHYAFVLTVFVFPSDRELKRSFFAACIFVGLVATLGAAFVLPHAWAAPLVAVAVVLQTVSFGGSFWQRYGPA